MSSCSSTKAVRKGDRTLVARRTKDWSHELRGPVPFSDRGMEMSRYEHRPGVRTGLLTRREMLCRCGAGFGALALADLLDRPGLLGAANPQGPLSPRQPHFPGKAKRVIHLFMNG